MTQKSTNIITRRNFLKLVAVGAGTSAVGLYALNKSGQVDYSDPAYLYWNKESKGALNLERYLVLCASLAPSAHNTQPWKFKIADKQIDVFADRNRHLGDSDKDFRMMLMSIGCAVENIRIAANQLGHRAHIKTVANDEFQASGLCARIWLSQRIRAYKDELFHAIFDRQTTRAGFIDIPVPDSLTDAINKRNDMSFLTLHWFQHPQQLQRIVQLQREAVRSFIADDAAYLDSLKWWRYTRDEILHKRDGISIFTSCASTLIKQYFQFSVDQQSMAGEFGKNGEVELMDALFEATPLWGAITSSRRDEAARLAAGQLLERVYLEVTRQHHRIMPVSYVTEQETFAQRMKDELDMPPNEELLSVFRIGQSERCEKSPRRALSNIIA